MEYEKALRALLVGKDTLRKKKIAINKELWELNEHYDAQKLAHKAMRPLHGEYVSQKDLNKTVADIQTATKIRNEIYNNIY